MKTLEVPSDKRCVQVILHSALLLAFGVAEQGTAVSSCMLEISR